MAGERALEHGAVDRGDDGEFLGDSDERGRGKHAARRMTPARQRLDADDLVGAGIDLRLEIGNELAALEPADDAVADALGVEDLGLQRGGVEFEAVAAEALGAIEREIGVDQQPLAVDVGAVSAGDADAHAQPALVAGVDDRPADVVDDPPRQFVEARHAGVGVADDDEFVAAGAGDEVAGPQMAADRLGGVDEHRVAGRMAERVVDPLESVEIDLQQRDAAAGFGAARGVLLERALEIHAVGQAGEEVVQRIVFDAGARRFELGVARLGQRLRAGQVVGQLDVGCDVPVDADHLSRQVGRDVELADGADHPLCARRRGRADTAIRSAACAWNAAVEFCDRAIGVGRVEAVAPMRRRFASRHRSG